MADNEDEAFLQIFNAKNKLLPPSASSLSHELSIDCLERALSALERATKFDAIVSLSRAEQLFQDAGILQNVWSGMSTIAYKQAVQGLYQYWVNMRCKLKKPLLRIYWPVTSPHDTNPHLVFRPREKEKYRLRKKRQNDLEGYKKLVQLKVDFESVKNLISTVQAREHIMRAQLELRAELFEQKIYDCVDTSGLQRKSSVNISSVEDILKVPIFISTEVQQKRKRKREQATTSAFSEGDIATDSESYQFLSGMNGGVTDKQKAPSFLDDIASRTSYVTSWDNYDPWWDCVVSSEDDEVNYAPFVHRHRIGRGGRIIVDRLPRSDLDVGAYPDSMTLFDQPQVGNIPPKNVSGKLDYIPDTSFFTQKNARIAEIFLQPIPIPDEQGEFQQQQQHQQLTQDIDDALLVNMQDYIDACGKSQDAPLWGEERFTIGPV